MADVIPIDDDDIKRKFVHRMVWIIAGIVVLIAVGVSLHLIVMHNRNWTRPLIQRKIVGILWMVPIYAIDSWLSLVFIHSAVYLDMIRDCYEAYVIYLFLALMIAYLGNGNDYRVIEILEDLEPLPQPFPLNYCWSPILMDSSFLRRCKLGAMQFVIIKPLMTFVAVILESVNLYDQGSFNLNRGYFYVCFIQNVSITYAFYWLVMFYVALQDHLRPYDPVPKFIVIKSVLFLSFWQGVIIATLTQFGVFHEVGSYTVENISTGLQNLLLCFEMCIAAFAHYFAFPYQAFKKPQDESNEIRLSLIPMIRSINIRDQLALDDAVSDFNEVMPGRILLPSSFRPGSPTILDRNTPTDRESSGSPNSGGRGGQYFFGTTDPQNPMKRNSSSEIETRSESVGSSPDAPTSP